MNLTDFTQVVDNARSRQDKILKDKGNDYTRHEEDRLSNFKRSAAAIGLTPLQVWAIFVNKHMDAIMAFVKTGRTESEHIQGRFDDVQNYLYLGEALVIEQWATQEARTETSRIEPGLRAQGLCGEQNPTEGWYCSQNHPHMGTHSAYKNHIRNADNYLGSWS